MYITFMISDFLTWWLKTSRSSKVGENFASQERGNCRGVQCILLHPRLSGGFTPSVFYRVFIPPLTKLVKTVLEIKKTFIKVFGGFQRVNQKEPL